MITDGIDEAGIEQLSAKAQLSLSIFLINLHLMGRDQARKRSY